MFREINVSKQDKEGPKRRWYQSDYFDLYIFYIRHGARMDKHADREFVGLQLCYDIRRNQRTLEWKQTGGFSHHAVKKGGDTLDDHGASAALLQKGGVFDAEKVIDRFMRDSPGLPGQVSTFMMKKLTEYAKVNAPAAPAALAAARPAAARPAAAPLASAVAAAGSQTDADLAAQGEIEAAYAAEQAAYAAAAAAVAPAVPVHPSDLDITNFGRKPAFKP